MPSYDFRCPQCDERFEVTRPAGQANGICCPECGAAAKRIFTPVGVVFKGSGFHNTDYRSRPKDDSSGSKPDAAASNAPTSDSPSSGTPPCAGGDGGGCAGCPAAS